MLPQSKRPSYSKTSDIRDNISSNNTMQAPSQNWMNYDGNTDNRGYLWKENEHSFTNGKQDGNAIHFMHNEGAPSLNAMPNTTNFGNNISEENGIPMPAQFDLSTFQTSTNGFLPTNFAINNNGMVMPTIGAMNIPFYNNMKMGNFTSNQSDWDIVKAALSLNVTTPDFSSNSQDNQGNSMILSQTKNDSDKSQCLENDREGYNVRTKNYTITNDRNSTSVSPRSTEENNRLYNDLRENSDNKEKEIEKKMQINQAASSYHHPSGQTAQYLHKSLAQTNVTTTSVKNHKDLALKNDKITKDVNYNPLMRDLGNESSSQTEDDSPAQSAPTQSRNGAFRWERNNDTRKVAEEATIPRHSIERNGLSHIEDATQTNNYATKRDENKFSNANGKDIDIRSENMINKPLHDGSYDLTQQSSDPLYSNLKSASVPNSNANGKNRISYKTTIDNMKEDTLANRVDSMQNSKNKDNQDIALTNDLGALNIGSDDLLSKTSQHNNVNTNNTPNYDNYQGKKYQENKIRNYNHQKSATNNNDTDNKSDNGNNDSTKKPKIFKAPAAGTGQLHQTKKYNPSWVDLNNYRGARFFVIKSYYEDDIYYSIKTSTWSSTEYGNKKLNRAYCDCQGTRFIYLFFSVNGSGHFCGVARMTSEVYYEKSVTLWQQNKWEGKFSVQWIYVKDVPNFALKHIRLENNNYKAITNSRDCQEVPGDSARTAMKIIHHYQYETSIFDDFEYYESKLKQKVQKDQEQAEEEIDS